MISDLFIQQMSLSQAEDQRKDFQSFEACSRSNINLQYDTLFEVLHSSCERYFTVSSAMKFNGLNTRFQKKKKKKKQTQLHAMH